MANQKHKIQYVLDAFTDSGFTRTMRTVQKSVGGLKLLHAESSVATKKHAAATGMLGTGWIKSAAAAGLAYVGTQQLAGAYKSVIGEASEAAVINKELEFQMTKTSGATLKQIESVSNLAGKLQQVTTIEDDVTKAGASQLAVTAMRTKSILKLLPAMQDLAVKQYGMSVSQEQMVATAKLIDKAYLGNAGAFKKAGLEVTKQQAALLKTGNEAQKVGVIYDIINSKLGGLARNEAGTDPGKLIQMQLAWAAIKEEIGKRLLPVQSEVIGMIAKALPGISALIDRTFAAIDKAAPRLLPLMDFAGRIGKSLAGQNWGQIGGGILKVFTPIISFITGKLLPFIGKLSADIGGIIAKAWPVIQPALQQLGGAIGNLLNAVLPIVQKIWGIVKPVLSFVLVNVLPVIIKAVSWIVNLIATLIKKLMQANEWFVKIAGKVGAFIKGGGVAGMVVKAASSKIGARAAGGPVSSGRPYLVGERGPELMIPGRSGFIMPNAALAGAGGFTFSVGDIHIHGAGGDPQAIGQAVRGQLDDFGRKFNELLRDKSRRSFRDED